MLRATGHLHLLDVEMLVGVHETDRGADAAEVAIGRDHDHFEAGAVQPSREEVEPGRLDPVVVRYEDACHE